MKLPPSRKIFWPSLGAIAAIAAFVAGCTSAPPPAPVTRPAAPLPPVAKPQPAPPAPPVAINGKTSKADSPRAYRRDAAGHLYSLNANRIYRGKMPPLLYAVGVLQVELDAQGRVLHTSWMRAPSHAPEVMAEIERTVRNAAPFPAPVAMGRVTYTDTWLWHKSGKFQLDTLTEGQM
ncbi:MAG: hypothetical protein K2X51_11000 [Burkholderiales bacterium]|nr:hypothetical protein [Burkholderiales bacterium]